eukprot:8831463-Prorocentrum_lima.AAC.1
MRRSLLLILVNAGDVEVAEVVLSLLLERRGYALQNYNACCPVYLPARLCAFIPPTYASPNCS